MKIRRTEVKTYKVDAVCDHCDSTLVPTGNVDDKNPFAPKGVDLRTDPRYEYVCSGCHRKNWLSRSFPYTEYKEVRP